MKISSKDFFPVKSFSTKIHCMFESKETYILNLGIDVAACFGRGVSNKVACSIVRYKHCITRDTVLKKRRDGRIVVGRLTA